MESITHLYNVDHHIYWGILIATYFYYTGMSAGSFVLSSLGTVFGIEKYKIVAKTGIIMAIILLVFAPLHLIADLQQPTRFWHLLVNIHFTSAMSYGVFLLLLYPINCIIYAWFMFREDLAKYSLEKNNWKAKVYKLISLNDTRLDEKTLKRDEVWKKRFGVIGVPLALLVHGYTGFILADVQTRALWHTALMPWIFLMSAMVSGTGLFIIVLMIVEKFKNGKLVPEIRRLIVDMGQLMKWFIVVDAAMMISTFIMLWYGNDEAYAAGYFLLRGEEQMGFVGVEIIGGMLIPFILMSIPKIKDSLLWITIASLLTMVGVLAMRINFVIGGQKIPLTGSQLLEYEMEPSQLITSIVIAIVTLAVLAFFYYLLPMNHKYSLNRKRKYEVNSKKGETLS